METPPRTWRRHRLIAYKLAFCRNTSTDVEKTSMYSTISSRVRKHLHGRGEDFLQSLCVELVQETPPRTWRRPPRRIIAGDTQRNTSTDVEKTILPTNGDRQPQKHLHGRGEDSLANGTPARPAETPPRTWRRRRFCIASFCHFQETPPRTWRRRQQRDLVAWVLGNTSTDVEKTGSRAEHRPRLWKHLHGRGEDYPPLYPPKPPKETPPRTWRRQAKKRIDDGWIGNTSTDVEKT